MSTATERDLSTTALRSISAHVVHDDEVKANTNHSFSDSEKSFRSTCVGIEGFACVGD